MSKTVQEIYSEVVEILPLDERLRLATMILNDLTNKNISLVNYSDIWTQEDQIDIVNYSLQNIDDQREEIY
ncbi:hypothetical protein [Cyanobacterium sp. Dongsha4]|uniref:hypothetical protein n=1 Tax=Cyanobacterium sp. DS4 TaxID=2878255 RepID=UPI002E81C232|nr:hypothetical protein [Cyanobacterium sp. Dongsha4]WVK99851.1 hypothetical protein Dongsha4_14430 [Cyanobacterium sp. Dongsha4]